MKRLSRFLCPCLCCDRIVGTGGCAPFVAAEFDGNKQVTLKGHVTKVEWTNPHVWFYLNVKKADGTVWKTGASKWDRHMLWPWLDSHHDEAR